MIKIITGYSEKGGSTIAFINLTNLLNDSGIECIMYGPHGWHLDKCKSDNINNFIPNEEDVILLHFLKFKDKLKVKKSILVCHEKWWFDVGSIQNIVDEVVFLHQQHRDFHSNYTGKYSIIPNLKEELYSSDKTIIDNIAGVIGSIEDRKQTHISIDRAVADNCKKIFVIGNIGDQSYFDNFIKPRLNDVVNLVPYQKNKQKMYNALGRVYHSSKGEVACLVKDECYLTGTKFFGNEETEHKVSTLTNKEILEKWKQIFFEL